MRTIRAPQKALHQDPTAVRQARQARNLTQVALAATIGVTQSYLSEIECGTRSAPPDLLSKLADALACPVGRLERWRPLGCPECAHRFDPTPNHLVPLHTLPDSDVWCSAGGHPMPAKAAA